MTAPLTLSVEHTLDALPTDRFVKSRDLWREMQTWAPSTIRSALDELHRRGLADRKIEPIPGGVVHLFRRKA